jgi:gluconolactonase
MKLDLEVRDARLTQLVAAEAELETVASGFEFLEGPIWHPAGQFLIFSDIVGNGMYRWSKVDGVGVFRKPSQMANGNTYDRQWRILTCEHATSRVVRAEPDGRLVVLASHYDGQELNSPNDIVVKRDGTVYFTDPNFGRRPRVGVPRSQQLPFQAVYRFDPVAGTLAPVATDFGNPNGLCFSLDEKRLFVNDSPRHHIRVFDVQPDGTLTNGRVWAETVGEGVGVPDGMKFDSAGYLYCCARGGIHIFDPDGHCLGVVHMPEQAANFNWGDSDLQSLFICASTTLYRLRVKIPGQPIVR